MCAAERGSPLGQQPMELPAFVLVSTHPQDEVAVSAASNGQVACEEGLAEPGRSGEHHTLPGAEPLLDSLVGRRLRAEHEACLYPARQLGRP